MCAALTSFCAAPTSINWWWTENFKNARSIPSERYVRSFFGVNSIASFDQKKHETASNIDSLRLSELLEEDYIASGVIGGGLKSHFLLLPPTLGGRLGE